MNIFIILVFFLLLYVFVPNLIKGQSSEELEYHMQI